GDLEAAEVVLAVWIVVRREVGEGRHAADHDRLDVRGQGIDAGGKENLAAGHRPPERVVERPDFSVLTTGFRLAAARSDRRSRGGAGGRSSSLRWPRSCMGRANPVAVAVWSTLRNTRPW